MPDKVGPLLEELRKKKGETINNYQMKNYGVKSEPKPDCIAIGIA